MILPALIAMILVPQFEAHSAAGAKYTQVDLQKSKRSVWVFVLSDCPISNQYAPEINRIIKDYKPKGVDFSLVHVEKNMTVSNAKSHAKQYGYSCRILLDKNHSLVKYSGAIKVPEVAVLKPNGAITYLGRIDNLYYDLGKQRPKVTRKDLRIAIQESLENKTISVPKTDVVGCFIPKP